MSSLEIRKLLLEAAFQGTPAAMTVQRDRIAQTLDSIQAPITGGQRHWDRVEFLDPKASVMGQGLLISLRFIGHVTSLSTPYIPADLLDQEIQVVDVALTDHVGHPVQCWWVEADPWFEELNSAIESSTAVEIAGFVGLKPVRNGKRWILIKAFIICSVSKVTTMAQRAMAKRAEVTAAEATIKANPSLRPYLRAELIKRIGIVGIAKHPKLSLGLDFTILQALAFGKVDHNPGRLHSLAFGPPGVGKKLLALAIKLLNVNWTEANAAKLTVAGVQARAYRSGSKFKSDPGLIPLADLSTFIVQDAHGVKDKAGFNAVLSMAMEDGELMDSTSAKTRVQARTAIHLDLNKRTDLDPMALTKSDLDDMGMKMHVLSRFDCIVEFHRDTERQMEVHRGMLSGDSHVGVEDFLSKPQNRDLKVLVAVLRDAHELVRIPKDVNKRIQQELEILIADFDHPLLSDLLARMAISAKKLVAAQARLCDRDVVTAQDVDDILPFLEEKLQVLKTVAGPIMVRLKPKGPMKKAERLAWIQAAFAGQTISVQEVMDKLREAGETGSEKALERKVQRDLEKIAGHAAHGAWTIPGDPVKPSEPEDPAAPVAA